MKATKTKSGRWTAVYVDHYENIGGKRKIVQGRVTRDTKAEALQAAYELQLSGARAKKKTFSVALDEYIESKKTILSPTTLAAYRSLQRKAYWRLNRVAINHITSDLLQLWITGFAKKHKPKTVRNAFALVTAVLDMYRPDFRYHVTLPQKEQRDPYTPTDADVRKLMQSVRGTHLERAILLAAFGTLRRGEICALTTADIHGDEIIVNKSMTDRGLVKAPKTPQSVRTIKYPPEVIERLTEGLTQGDAIVDVRPNTLSHQFTVAREAAGLPYFRLHDLRAYAASMRHALLIPDAYIMRDGGWKTDNVLKSVYRRTMHDKRDEYADVMAEHMKALLSGEDPSYETIVNKKSTTA